MREPRLTMYLTRYDPGATLTLRGEVISSAAHLDQRMAWTCDRVGPVRAWVLRMLVRLLRRSPALVGVVLGLSGLRWTYEPGQGAAGRGK